MMQQLNAAKDRLGQDDDYSNSSYGSDYYDSEDEDYDEDYDDDYFDPFSGPSMNFAAFLRM